MNLNKAMIIGNVTRDPEVRTTPSGQTVASFSVATNFSWTDQGGQRQERVEFHNVVAWRKLAEICGTYLHKGKQVYIEGRLQTRDWTDQNGVRKFRTEIVAENMILLGGPRGTAGAPTAAPQQPANFQRPAAPAPMPQANSEIPVIDIDQDIAADINPNMGNYAPRPESDADYEEDVKVEDIPF
jgi:single-strand DNA-binding protein